MTSIEYIPKFTVSGRAMRLIMEIAAALERYKIVMEGPNGVRLRKINHVRTIRGTTAIEGNTLTEDQITAVLAGKRVTATRREIDEVKGAHRAYAKIETFNPYSVDDLLKAHALMTDGLVEHPGTFRRCAVGVMNGAGEVVHLAPRFELVPGLMDDLFAWINESDEPVLIKSCVFHWCFEDIHPFPDGNGRMGRFWQTALLGSWNPLFYAAPVENIVWAHQAEYYAAIQAVEAKNMDIAPFIEFMLDKILRTLKAKGAAYPTPCNHTRIALTGGIACGKSLVERFLREAGVETIDADAIVHELIPDPAERKRIAAEVFADPEKRKALEARLHPQVKARIDAFLAAAAPGRLRIAVVPLLFETRWDADYDIICCIVSDGETQLSRMMTARGYTRAEAEARMAAQMPVGEKAAKSHYVIENNGSGEELKAKVAAFVGWLKERSGQTDGRRV